MRMSKTKPIIYFWFIINIFEEVGKIYSILNTLELSAFTCLVKYMILKSIQEEYYITALLGKILLLLS